MAKKVKKLRAPSPLETLRQEIRDVRQEWSASKAALDVKFATIVQIADMFTTLRDVLNTASAALAAAGSYTKREIEAMSAEEYRTKVLVPLNMGRRRV